MISGLTKSAKTVTYQTSSLGKLNEKFLLSLYNQFDQSQKFAADAEKYFRIIFPTRGYVATSYLGIEGGSSIILQEQYWNSQGFPRKAFCKQEGKSKEMDKNLYHAKFMIVTD